MPPIRLLSEPASAHNQLKRTPWHNTHSWFEGMGIAAIEMLARTQLGGLGMRGSRSLLLVLLLSIAQSITAQDSAVSGRWAVDGRPCNKCRGEHSLLRVITSPAGYQSTQSWKDLHRR